MNGKILLKAAEIIVKVGPQADAILNKFEDLAIDIVKRSGYIVNDDDCEYDGNYDSSETICTDFYRSLFYKDKGKGQKRKSVIAANIVLYNENMVSRVENFEPSLFIYYKYSTDEHCINDIEHMLFDGTANIVDNRLFIKHGADNARIDSWMYVIPLVKIQNEDIIHRDIIDVIEKLIKNSEGYANCFSPDSVVFTISKDVDRIVYKNA